MEKTLNSYSHYIAKLVKANGILEAELQEAKRTIGALNENLNLCRLSLQEATVRINELENDNKHI